MVIVTYHNVTFISTAVQKKKEYLDLAQVESVSTKEQGTMTFLDWFSIFLVFHHSNKGFFSRSLSIIYLKEISKGKRREIQRRRGKRKREKRHRRKAQVPQVRKLGCFSVYI